jgi:hypothetical protein
MTYHVPLNASVRYGQTPSIQPEVKGRVLDKAAQTVLEPRLVSVHLFDLCNCLVEPLRKFWVPSL